MKKYSIIIGNPHHGKTALTAVIEKALKREDYSIYQSNLEKVFEINNPYAFLNAPTSPSKTRLKKCEKGLHEFRDTGIIEENKRLWTCIYCGKEINNR